MKNKNTYVNAKPIIPSTAKSSQTAVSNIHCYSCEILHDMKEPESRKSIRQVLESIISGHGSQLLI